MPPNPYAHIVLKTASDTNVTGIKLARDENGKLLYSWKLAPALAPDMPPQDVSYAEVPATQEMVWHQNDWRSGALRHYYDPEQPNHYAMADKVWTGTPNELSLGVQPHEVAWGTPNGGFELGSTSGWTGSGVTLTAVTTAPYAGAYHGQATGMGQNDYVSNTIVNALQPAARWQGQILTIAANCRGSVAGGAVTAQIVETGGVSQPTTTGSAVTLTTTYQSVGVYVTIQADTTQIEFRITRSDAGADITLYVDHGSCYVDVSGGVKANQNNCRMQVMSDGLVAVTNIGVWLFDETSDYMTLQKAHSVAITGAEIWDDRLFVGLGEATAYQYSAAGDLTSWTAATGSGTTLYANKFIKALNAAGNWAMAKTLNDDDVFLSTDPTDASKWGSVVQVGKDDHTLLQVFQIDGMLAIGKTDGFYAHHVLEGNRFINVYPGAEALIDADNFSRGLMYMGRFYTILGEIGLIRYDGTYWESLSHLLQSPGLSDFGNKALAFGTNGDVLYVVVEDLNTDTISKEGWLYALKEFSNGQWQVHQRCSLVTSDALDAMVTTTTGVANKSLFINGMSGGSPMMYRLLLPNKTDIPRLALNKDLSLSGEFITSWWDGNRPQVQKAFNKLDLISESLSGTSQYVTVAYQVDNESSWTNINSSDSTFETSPAQTIAFNTGVTGRRIRLRFTLTTTSSTASPVVKGFVLHASWRPTRLKQWTLAGVLADDMTALGGVPHALPAAKMISQLSTLQTTVPPITMLDIDGTTQTCHITEMAEQQFGVKVRAADVPEYSRVVYLTIQEVKTS